MIFKREIEKRVRRYLQPNKVVVIYGPRRVGKTTFLKEFLKTAKEKWRYDTGDNIRVQEIFLSQDLKKLKEYVEGYEFIVIDEAQRIPKIGWGLKLLVDNIEKTKVIATGSSSFELSGQVGEPLVGRRWVVKLFPLSLMELGNYFTFFELKENLEEYLIFGTYPEVLKAKTKEEKREILNLLVESYLLRDILELERVKGAKVLLDLLRLIAFQVGKEISLSELGEKLGIDYKTVRRYLDLFEKTFILYNLRGLSRNLRKEIYSKSKYYFLDNGIRNAIISNFNPLEIRDDVGVLWENFLVAERLKVQEYKRIFSNNYFWRTWDGKEIDWIEEREGKFFAYEFKLKRPRKTYFSYFKNIYPKSQFGVVTMEDFREFVGV